MSFQRAPATHRSRRATAMAAATALLAACGGGGGEFSFGDLSTEYAEGWAADAATAPPVAAAAVDNATLALEAALQSGAVQPGSDRQALSARPLLTVASVPCVGGGSIGWTVTGPGTNAQLLDGRLDAGETFEIVYSACGDAATGMSIDGRASLAVAANSDTASDWTLSASALQVTTPQGRDTLDGSVRQRRTTTLLPGGGTQTRVALTSPGLSMTSRVGTRQSSTELRTLDWTVTRSTDATGHLGSRSHDGTLVLVTRSPRRPTATLQIAAQGTVVAGSGGYASQGTLTIVTGDGDRIGVAYSPTSVSLTLDIGNDGRRDRTWTLPRGEFDAGRG